MRRSTVLIPTGVLAVAGTLTGLALWLTQPSYADRVQDCAHALKSQHTRAPAEPPGACAGVKADDYAELVTEAEREGRGGVDEKGRFEEDEHPDALP
ncbi:hypothetical protein RB200_13285 [Streptomyces sp. PmtG]